MVVMRSLFPSSHTGSIFGARSRMIVSSSSLLQAIAQAKPPRPAPIMMTLILRGIMELMLLGTIRQSQNLHQIMDEYAQIRFKKTKERERNMH